MSLHPLALVSLAMVGLMVRSATADPSAFHIVEDSQGVTILDGIRPVLTFQRGIQSQDGRWPRADFVHPLYHLDGEVVTENFPSDHGHHRGVFWAWHRVAVGDKILGDAWVCERFEWNVIQLATQTTAERAVISATTLWQSPDWVDDAGQMIPVVREQATISVHPQQANVRSIDFDLHFLALVQDVSLAGSDDNKGYGGFSPRFKLSEQTIFRGTEGEVIPQQTAIQAGPWIDVSEAGRGVAILTHPDNPGFPQPWILRQKRSMQNPVYPGNQPASLSTTTPLRLRYRLVLHGGPLEASAIDEYHQQYSQCD